MSEYLRPEYTPLFREVQDTIAGYLNSDPQISAKQIEFIPEAHLDIDFQVKKALGQQGIVGVVNTMKGEFAGHNGSTNAWQIEAEVDVIENPPVRRSQLKKMGLSTGTVSDIIDWVQESMCGPSSPTFARFSPVTQEIGESNGLVVGRAIMRSIVIADVSAVISGGNQWKCPYALEKDLSALASQVEEIEYDISGKADVSALDNYFPITGDPEANVLVGTLSANDAIYALKSVPQRLAVFRTGFNGNGLITQYQKQGVLEHTYDDLLLPRTEDGVAKTIATEEWTQGEISGKADTTALANYLPLSGGNVDGYLSVGNNVVLEYDLGGGVVRLSDGNGNWTYLQGNRISNNGSNFYFPLPPYPDDYTLATQEWTTQTALSSYMKATAMTQAEYDQITPDPTTLYVITES